MPKEYTSEETNKIVVGLLWGNRPRGRGMTDKEYQQRMDPQGYRDDQMIETLNKIDAELKHLNDERERVSPTVFQGRGTHKYGHPYQNPTKPQSKPVNSPSAPAEPPVRRGTVDL